MSSLRIDPARFDEIKSYLAAHPTHGSRRISRALGVPRSSVERALQHLTRHKHTLLGVTGVWLTFPAVEPQRTYIVAVENDEVFLVE